MCIEVFFMASKKIKKKQSGLSIHCVSRAKNGCAGNVVLIIDGRDIAIFAGLLLFAGYFLKSKIENKRK